MPINLLGVIPLYAEFSKKSDMSPRGYHPQILAEPLSP